jgi:2-oxo-hept-3-ene-1,7-dioate hydratase
MLSTELIEALARELYDARKNRVQVRQFSRRHPGMTIEDGYAIQRAWVRLEQADGRSVKGRKIGLTSRAMQQASQITEPDYAPLMDDMFFAQGGDIPIARFIAPRIEVELDIVSPALEIIDARIEQFDRDDKAMRKVFDTISDFAANAGIVLGGRPVRADAVDLRWAGAMLFKNGVIEETGLAAGVLNHPATGVAWLANKIAAHDEQLNVGDVVLAGSFTRPITAVAGDGIHADYGPLGTISFRFA